MSHISKPVDWEVFNIPPIQPVQYYSVLKKKREFSQLIKQYDAQVFKQGYVHYCGIVPKNLSSSFNNRYEIFIVFFDETPNTSFIGFRVKVSKETFMHESNSLLLFLKKSKKAIFYLMNNNCIHVQCGTNAWELFYLLYDDYLRRYVLTIIGTQFFCHFVYSCCIRREIQLLEMLYKGSKVIRVSKKSIYYKIHRKRKISVTDLIHMTLNMPKSKRYIVSCFSSKESVLYSDMKDGDFYTAVGSKINVSKLMLKKFKKQNSLIDDTFENPVIFEEKMPVPSGSVFYPYSEPLVPPFTCKAYTSEKHTQKLSFSNNTLKRKFDETELHPSTSKSCKTSDSCSVGNQWKQYQNLKPYSVKCYSGIPFINPLVPTLLTNETSSHFNSNSYLLKTHSNAFMRSLMVSDKEKKVNDTSAVQETHELIDHFKSHKSYAPTLLIKDTNYKFAEAIAKSEIPYENKNSLVIRSDCVMPRIFSSNQPNFHSVNNVEKDCDIKATTTLSLPRAAEHTNQDSTLCLEDISFTTAAGKTINISDTAMLKAHQLIENDCNDENEQLPGTVTYNVSKKICSKTPNFKTIYPDSRRKNITKDTTLPKIAENKFCCDISLKNNEMMPKKCTTAVSTNTDESFRLDTVEDVGFSTAAGRTINISSTAIEAAQKLIQDVIDEEKMPQELCSRSRHLCMQTNKICKNTSAFKNIGCSSKATDIDMDKTLVEKFFEDTLFDEKELELTDDSNKNDKSDAVVESKGDNLPARKPRKSLGGRRSMKYCSDKLQ